MYRKQCPECGTWNHQYEIKSVKKKDENTLEVVRHFFLCGHYVTFYQPIFRGKSWRGYCYTTWYKRDSDGKIVIASIPEHRAIWEQAHGELLKDWDVHHINRVKDDNRIENLIAMPSKAHSVWM
jgi:hypothetical protein